MHQGHVGWPLSAAVPRRDDSGCSAARSILAALRRACSLRRAARALRAAATVWVSRFSRAATSTGALLRGASRVASSSRVGVSSATWRSPGALAAAVPRHGDPLCANSLTGATWRRARRREVFTPPRLARARGVARAPPRARARSRPVPRRSDADRRNLIVGTPWQPREARFGLDASSPSASHAAIVAASDFAHDDLQPPAYAACVADSGQLPPSVDAHRGADFEQRRTMRLPSFCRFQQRFWQRPQIVDRRRQGALRERPMQARAHGAGRGGREGADDHLHRMAAGRRLPPARRAAHARLHGQDDADAGAGREHRRRPHGGVGPGTAGHREEPRLLRQGLCAARILVT